MPRPPKIPVRRPISSKSTSNHSVEISRILQEGVSFHRLGKLKEAKDAYEKILTLQNNHFDALQLLATIYSQVKQYELALEFFDRALLINKNNSAVFNNRGNTLKELKRFDEALKSYDEALRIKADYAEAFNNRGNTLKELKRFDEALKSYDEAIRIKADYAEAFNNRGITLKELKRFDEALKSYDEAIRIKADYAEAFNNRGNTLKELKRFDEALKSYDEALRIKADYAEAFNNRGITLQELKRFDEALKSYDEALRIKADYAEAFNNRGITLQELKRFDEALKSYDEAIRIKADYAEAFNNRGITLQELKRFDEALKSYDEALRIKADYAEAIWNKSLLLILLGNYLEGWKLYESRLVKDDTKKHYPVFKKIAWRGQESIKDKILLIHTEQGLGDTIQFVRYIEKIQQLGAKVILEVPKPLFSLVGSLKLPITVIEKGNKLPEFDAYCPLLSLPYIFKTTIDTIPANVPYLFTEESKVTQWETRLGKKTCKRIGIVWSGSTSHKNDHNRSIPLEMFGDLFGLPFEWHSLQKEYRGEDKKFLECHPELIQHQDNLHDFSDTAALVECMDLVISVDTSVAHLAGALGKSLWLLLPYMPDYRWMLHREDSPWYPSARLFRQDISRHWSDVIGKVERNLKNLI